MPSVWLHWAPCVGRENDVEESGWIVWLVIGGVLCVAELATGTFYLLVAGLAALGAALAAWLGGGLAVQLAVAAGLGVAGLPLARRIARPRQAPPKSLDEGLAVRLVMTDGGLRADHSGSLWRVSEVAGKPLAAGDTVRIVRLDGNTLIVTKGE